MPVDDDARQKRLRHGERLSRKSLDDARRAVRLLAQGEPGTSGSRVKPAPSPPRSPPPARGPLDDGVPEIDPVPQDQDGQARQNPRPSRRDATSYRLP